MQAALTESAGYWTTKPRERSKKGSQGDDTLWEPPRRQAQTIWRPQWAGGRDGSPGFSELITVSSYGGQIRTPIRIPQ